MPTDRYLRWFAAFLLGAVSFFLIHLGLAATWDRFFAAAEIDRAWFLGSRSSILVTQAALFLVALGAGLWSKRNAVDRFIHASALVVGVAVGMSVLLLVLGPANLLTGRAELWPVALLSGLLLVVPAIGLGAALAAWIRR